MKILISLTVLLAALWGASALAGEAVDAPDPCDDPMTQSAMNMCAFQDYQRADEALNAIWPRIREAAKRRDENAYSDEDRGLWEAVLEGQRGWLTYREHHCAAEGFVVRGGSMEPLLVSGCKAGLTNKRVDQLDMLLSELSM
jgi:uncharacterized protein YecT (DUF1311 family)